MIRFLPLLLLSFILSGCISQTYEVQSVCEVTDVYNYVVKWEVSPRMDGNVEIYSSADPERFDKRRPVAVELISKGRADIVIKGSLNRCYFLLCFPDGVQNVVGVRSQKFSSVENFRDVGGYLNTEMRSVKWGRLYRSGNFDSISPINAKRVAKMHVKTFIDLRTKLPQEEFCPLTHIPHFYHLPVLSKQHNPLPLILQQQFKRGDAIVFMQDVYREMLVINRESFREMFRLLLNNKNYPVILSCRYGNIQTSLATALILSALDIPEQVIMEDYLLSNKYFNMRRIAGIAMQLPLESQDAITSMMVSDERYLNSALDLLKRRYGSVAEYLRAELGIDEDDRNKLKAILLE